MNVMKHFYLSAKSHSVIIILSKEKQQPQKKGRLQLIQTENKSLLYAISYFRNGWIPIPICRPSNGECGCTHYNKDGEPIRHGEKYAGKAPLVKYKDMNITKKTIIDWFTSFSNANIGILIKESGLVVLDIDGNEAITEIIEKGYELPSSPIARTGKGEHRIFRADDRTPITRAIQRGDSQKIDILTDGFFIVEPSMHRTGTNYKWIVKPKDEPLQPPPEWILHLMQEQEKKKVTVSFSDDAPAYEPIDIDKLSIKDEMKELIRRFPPDKKADRDKLNIDRSRDAAKVAFSMFRKGYGKEILFRVLVDKSNGISHRYYEGVGNSNSVYKKAWHDVERLYQSFIQQ